MTITVSTLEQYLDDRIQAETNCETRESFRIETQDQANWACRKLARIESKRAEIKATAEREIARIQEWAMSETQRLDEEAEFFTALLDAYHRRVIADDPKAKTITLPYGVLKLRAQQPEYIRDDRQLLPWVEANKPDCVRVKKETDWARLKSELQFVPDPERPHILVAVDPATGERVPGVEALERPDKFSVEVKA